MTQQSDKALKRGYLWAWVLVAFCLVYVVGFWFYNFAVLNKVANSDWDLDDKAIVPAASVHADGYDTGIVQWQATKPSASEAKP
jgi:hypothetical protein